MILLEVERVSAGYKGTPALFDVSLKVYEGEFVSVVGSNGAGKTTLLRTISGIVKPTQGTIKFQGQRIDGLSADVVAAKYRIAHVPEGRLLFPRLTVTQNLFLGAYPIKNKMEKETLTERVYELFPRLYERREQLAGTLSGGEQQMLAIGRGLMLDPVLLMLDEPSLGVAPNLIMRIYESLAQINEQGMTVLLVEQNVEQSLEMATRAYVIQTGKVVAEGKGHELLDTDLVRKAYLGQ